MFKTRRLVIICCLFVSMAVGGAPVFAAAPAESVINSGAADLFWGTYLGGSSAENGAHIVVADDGAIYIAGYTMSADLPATVGSYDSSYNGKGDTFAAKLSADGKTLEYLTYLGGTEQDGLSGFAVDGSGVAYVCGTTQSSDFPTTVGCYDSSYNGSGDVYVAKLSADGSSLTYGTFLGGTSTDTAGDLAIDGDGAIYLTGSTESTDFPAASGPGYDTSHNDMADAFVVKMAADGASLTYATFLGGTIADGGAAICVDDLGAAYVAGYTISSDFPTTVGAYDTTANGGPDIFVTKVMTDGLSLTYSTLLGGSARDDVVAVAVDSSGAVYVAGDSESSNFPTTAGVFGTTLSGICDVVVAQLSADGSSLLKSTYVGGAGTEDTMAMIIDGSGNVYVTGSSNDDLPLGSTPGFDTSRQASSVGWMFELGSLFDGLEYATYLEGAGSTGSNMMAVARDSDGDVYVAGGTAATDFDAIGRGYDSSQNGGFDIVLCKLSLTGEGNTGTRLIFPFVYQAQ